MAALDATCAWANPRLVLVAIAVALLDLTVATQRWTVEHPTPPAPARTVIVTVMVEGCSPVLAPELRDMVGHD